MRLLLLRHGETPWTITGQHTGRTELELTVTGERQAMAQRPVVAQLLGGEAPVVLVSPRRRTLRTAELALPDIDHMVEPAIEELDYGDYEGMTQEQIEEIRRGWNIWRDGCPGGETVADVVARIEPVLAEVSAAERPVIMVTHGHTSRIIAATAVGLSGTQGAIFDSNAGSLGMLGPHHGRTTVQLWNQRAEVLEA